MQIISVLFGAFDLNHHPNNSFFIFAQVDILNEYSGPSCSAIVLDKYQHITFVSITGVTWCQVRACSVD